MQVYCIILLIVIIIYLEENQIRAWVRWIRLVIQNFLAVADDGDIAVTLGKDRVDESLGDVAEEGQRLTFCFGRVLAYWLAAARTFVMKMVRMYR